ncbi:MAG: group 1 glycosyl transferase [Candidatus Saccharibacteria bacterium]|nr:group 1 glycosyl transferase [Candidatus Saccharibacteria bacterium]
MSKVKVLQFSSRRSDNCGVGIYEENFMDIFQDLPDEIETKFFDSSPYKTRVMSEQELAETMERLKTDLQNYDILHIQHEFGLYSGDEFALLVDTAKAMGKKVAVTVHLSPALAFKWKPRQGIGPRSAILVLRQKRLHGIFKKRHIDAFKKADLLFTHNNGATRSLLNYGVKRDQIAQIHHPVLPFTKPAAISTEIADNLNKKDGDVIYATVGFMHQYKGIDDAVRALKFLPDNYKLAIIGGMQPISDEVNIYNTIATLIDTLDLKDRVYITGYVDDDDSLNALIREVDVCVYAYNNVYYGQVSSGALNLAFANQRAVIGYPTDSFKEMNQEFGEIKLTSAAAYYELARELKRIDITKQVEAGDKYAEVYSWPKIAEEVIEAYEKLT